MKLLLISMLLILSGCSLEVGKVQLKEAEDICQLNGGLQLLIVSTESRTTKVVCNNGLAKTLNRS